MDIKDTILELTLIIQDLIHCIGINGDEWMAVRLNALYDRTKELGEKCQVAKT